MDKSGGGFLAQGGYGCVYYPEVNCQGKDTNNKNFLTPNYRKNNIRKHKVRLKKIEEAAEVPAAE